MIYAASITAVPQLYGKGKRHTIDWYVSGDNEVEALKAVEMLREENRPYWIGNYQDMLIGTVRLLTDEEVLSLI